MSGGSRNGRSNTQAPPGHLIVGIVHRPHGLHGETAAELLSDVTARFEAGSRLSLTLPNIPGPTRSDIPPTSSEVVIETSRRHAGRWLLRFQGYYTREQAEMTRGGILSIPREEAIVADGQYLLDELTGTRVKNAAGEELGVVVAVWDYPAQDLLEVETAKGSCLIPFVAALVPEVRLEEQVLILDSAVEIEDFLKIASSRSLDRIAKRKETRGE